MNRLAIIVVSALAPSIALPCSCAPSSGCGSVSGETLAFVGKAIAIHIEVPGSYGPAVSVDFSVSEAFGKLQGKANLTVYTHAQSTACGYPFRAGVEYFVSTNARGPNLWTNKCSRTDPANVSAGLVRQLRLMQAGKPPAQIFGYVGVEPYPGVSPLSRLEAKPTAAVGVTASSERGQFHTKTAVDGSFEFTGLPESTYRLSLELPKNLFIWWARNALARDYEVAPGKVCEADFPLYPEGDPFAANQPR